MRKQWVVFCEDYLKHWNATKAAITAGYSERTAYSQGPRLLKNVEVQAYLKARLSELQMGTDEIMVRWTEQARNVAAQYIKNDGTVDLPKIIEDGKQHLIKGIKYDARGKQVVEFCDPQMALDRQTKIQGLYKDKETAPQVNVTVEGFEQLLNKVYGDADSDGNAGD